jgi:hypothetical protein
VKVQIVQTPRCRHCLDDMTFEQDIEVWVGNSNQPVYVCSQVCADMYAKLCQEVKA